MTPAGAHAWSTYLGGTADDSGYGIAVDGDGNVCATGKTTSYVTGWVSGGWNTTANGTSDGFVVKLAPAGMHVWSTYLGGTGDDSLVGNGGMDVLSGESGNDTVAGGSGADMISGGDGDDLLAGMSPEQSFVDDGALDGFDTLDGGAGNDTLMLGHGDRGTGGAGDDDFVLDQRDDSSVVTSVVDFGAGDSVALFYTPTFGSDGAEIAPEISVSPSEDGLAGQISFNGQVVAHVTGGQNLTADDISLIADPGR